MLKYLYHLFNIWFFVLSTDFLIIYYQAIMIFNWSDYTPITYGDYTFPIWAEVVGYGIAAVSLICIPAGMVKAIFETSGDTYIMVSTLRYLSFTWTYLPLIKLLSNIIFPAFLNLGSCLLMVLPALVLLSRYTFSKSSPIFIHYL